MVQIHGATEENVFRDETDWNKWRWTGIGMRTMSASNYRTLQKTLHQHKHEILTNINQQNYLRHDLISSPSSAEKLL